jgi:hypothetical protein
MKSKLFFSLIAVSIILSSCNSSGAVQKSMQQQIDASKANVYTWNPGKLDR